MQTAPSHIIFTKDDITRTFEVVYFKRNNNQVLVDHLEMLKKRMTGLGYSFETIHPEKEIETMVSERHQMFFLDWDKMKEKMNELKTTVN